MTEADFERELFAAQAQADKLRGRRGWWHRLRAYLPGSQAKDKWGEPSANVYFHNVHICHIG
jgi:hypothetical protein